MNGLWFAYGDCTAITSGMDCSPAAFVSWAGAGVWGFSALVRRKNKWKGAVDSHFCSHQRPSHGRHKHCCSVESLGEMSGSLGGWPTFAPLFGLLERAASSAAEHTQLVMLSLLTAGARLYKPLPMRHVQMLLESSILCMHVFSAQGFLQNAFSILF